MACRQLHAAVCLLLLVGCTSLTPTTSPQTAAPILAWSNQAYFQDDGASSYQVYIDVHDTLKALMGRLLEQTPQVVLVVLGSQLKATDLHSGRREQLQPLSSLLEDATSSLSLPYVLHKVAPAATQQSRLVQLVSDIGAAVQVVGCGAESSQGLQAVQAALQQVGSEPTVVVMCTAKGSAAAGTPAAIAAEVQQVVDAHAVVAALHKKAAVVYASTPDAEALPAPRRQLLGADVGVCGQLCQTQVKWLEGILAAAILAIAAFSGMCCLYMLDTPTRFEKPKDGARND